MFLISYLKYRHWAQMKGHRDVFAFLTLTVPGSQWFVACHFVLSPVLLGCLFAFECLHTRRPSSPAPSQTAVVTSDHASVSPTINHVYKVCGFATEKAAVSVSHCLFFAFGNPDLLQHDHSMRLWDAFLWRCLVSAEEDQGHWGNKLKFWPFLNSFSFLNFDSSEFWLFFPRIATFSHNSFFSLDYDFFLRIPTFSHNFEIFLKIQTFFSIVFFSEFWLLSEFQLFPKILTQNFVFPTL